MKYTDKTDDEWSDLIDKWHEGNTELTLKEFLCLDDFEYRKLCFGVRDDSITEPELSAYQKHVADVITGRIKEGKSC